MNEDEDTETPTDEAVDDAPAAEEPAGDAPEQDAPDADASAAEPETGTDKGTSEDARAEETADASGEDDVEFEWTDAESAEATPVGDDLVDRVTALDEELGAEVERLVDRAFELKDETETLRARVEELESEADDLREEREDFKQRLVRKQADFKNYKERSKKKQEQIQERATEDLVERIVPVRDNLVRALEQDESADIRDGIEATLREFDRVLEDENVEKVSPEPGGEVDPQRHEVMVRVDSDKPDGAIVDVYRPGYEMGGKVIQTAQVTVSNGSDYDGDEAVPLGGEVEDDGTDAAASDGGAPDDESPESVASSDEEVGEAIGEQE
ncbi:nucleotide exchange factor GrpE [Haloarchaeobius amylolyticus]|uniref:nucleotide exchange factor GrpE n=1 Tax=Haloarchaeobius amylolyticus TaxID=1198296 RepID=UPI0034A213BE